MNKPLIFYVDDEEYNLAVFEANIDSELCDVKVFDNPFEALSEIKNTKPCVIVSDQRMPKCTGFQFLSLVKDIDPNIKRIVLTGFTDQPSLESFLKSNLLFSFIKKPFEPADVQAIVKNAIAMYQMERKSEEQFLLVEKREKELYEKNILLETALKNVEILQKEYECWVPPLVTFSLKQGTAFPMEVNLVIVTFDIINSSTHAEMKIENFLVRSVILNAFTENILKFGGWQENHGGDSAYGHFLVTPESNAFEKALCAIREFRTTLRNLNLTQDTHFEVGIALHCSTKTTFNVQKVVTHDFFGKERTQKYLITLSSDIDLLHRMERLAHTLPGSNIIMSRAFKENLKELPPNLQYLGEHLFRGQAKSTEVFMIPSDSVKKEDIEKVLGIGLKKIA